MRQAKGGRTGEKGGGGTKPPSQAAAPQQDGKPQDGKGRRGGGAITISDILEDRLTELSRQHWPNKANPSANKFDPSIVDSIYNDEIGPDAQAKSHVEGARAGLSQRLQLLEFSSYLESYLWHYFDPVSSSLAHVMSIALLINQKFREGVPAWEHIREAEDAGEKFKGFFVRVVELYLGSPLIREEGDGDKPPVTEGEKLTLVMLLINCFQAFEEPIVRDVILRLVSMTMWNSISPGTRAAEFEKHPLLKRHWQHFAVEAEEGSSNAPERKRQKKSTAASSGGGTSRPKDSLTSYEPRFMPAALDEFLAVVEALPKPKDPTEQGKAAKAAETHLRYAERFLELLVDLLSQLSTRRFFRAVMADRHVGVRLTLSGLPALSPLASQLLDSLKFYLAYEMNEHTGKPLSDQDIAAAHFSKVHILQRLAFKYYRDQLQDLAFASSQVIGDSAKMRMFLNRLAPEQIKELATRLRLLDLSSTTGKAMADRLDLVKEILVEYHTARISMIQEVNERPLYPSEKVLWDKDVVPSGHHDGAPLALPKLNLQFLTFLDYLLRSYTLYRVESAYGIREDIMDAIKYVGARKDPVTGQVLFGGWSRMAVPLESGAAQVVEVRKPNLGERVPATVKAEIQVDLTRYQGSIRAEWDQLREHDVVFLVTIDNPEAVLKPGEFTAGPGGKKGRGQKNKDIRLSEEDEALEFCKKYGVKYVRGAEIWEVRDEQNYILNDPSGRPDVRKGGPVGNKRTYKVYMDPAQYHADVKVAGGPGLRMYEGLNLLVRRNAKENNFKAVLETIRDLMNTAAVGKAVPPWLHDVFLGYGDPKAPHYRRLKVDQQLLKDVDFFDTFLDLQHLRDSFPDYKVRVEGDVPDEPYPPLKLDFVNDLSPAAGGEKEVVAKPYKRPNPGPYPQDQPQRNSVRFTPVQLEAIRSGLNLGLTMVVGPPGTGKTDVAVQIISNLYHAYPNQRTLLVTHSNAALNDLFEKIMARDIDPRHLLRLGAGERELAVNMTGGAYDFSKWGRVNYTLARRLELLEEVQRLAASVGVPGDVSYTCETADYFRLEKVQSRIEKFEADITKAGKDAAAVVVTQHFPFHEFFSTAPRQPLFKGESFEEDLETARGCFRHLNRVFEELEDYRAFELLRNHTMRGDYLLTKQARIVAMTCTHAALTRRKLVTLGFKFDNLVMEEAAQVLEVETFIPMLLQDVDTMDGARLKRAVLIGDHHQLPPIIQNMALQKYSHMEQSLFARFVRLGVATVDLNRQGRARPSLASLYSWRYKDLGNLDNVLTRPAYVSANPGFVYDFQLVNVEDFNGFGESTPSAYFYQNLGEAEYVVAVYQYMRLCGYPAEKVSILTTYNGQKHLIRDVLRQRCSHPLFGMPGAVATVDKYQGQQNDYVLLSLVRTKHIGHIRDVRRLVVAMSRARLGLYVFCRQRLFENCYELTQAFNRLLSRPPVLALAVGERYGETPRKADDTVAENLRYQVPDVTHMGALVQQLVNNYSVHVAAQQAAIATARQQEAEAAAAMDVARDEDGGAVNGEANGVAEEANSSGED